MVKNSNIVGQEIYLNSTFEQNKGKNRAISTADMRENANCTDVKTLKNSTNKSITVKKQTSNTVPISTTDVSRQKQKMGDNKLLDFTLERKPSGVSMENR